MKTALHRALSWMRGHKLKVAIVLILVALLIPRPSQSQIPSPCCVTLSLGLSTIASTLRSVIGGGLQAINSVQQAILTFQQNVVWPQAAINQARALVASIRGIFGQIHAIAQLPVNSATLPKSRQLEQTLLSRTPSRIAQAGADYKALYAPLPPATDASPEVRDLIDMTDAVAQAAMKRAIAIDALADLELQAADRINQEIQSAAPGSAPILEAQAAAWLVRANAYTQSALADLMRVRATDLANAGAELKAGAAHSGGIRQDVNDILKRR
jgi:hypothetical protein